MRITFAPASCRCFALTFAFLVTACSKPGPATDDLKSAVATNIPGATVKTIKCEAFADKMQEGAGRANCKGTAALDQDQYAVLSPNEVGGMLSAAGIPEAGTGFFLQRHPQEVYAPVVSKGTETDFSADCNYQKEVDAWRIGCTTNYQPFAGQPLANINGAYVVKDTAAYEAWLKDVTTDYRQLEDAYRAAEATVKTFFAPGKTIVLRDRQTQKPWYEARIVSALSWNGDPGFLGHQGSFWTISKYQDLRDRTNQTLCGYGKGQPIDDLLLSGSIDFTPNSPQGPFTPHVEVVERNSLFNNTFTGCGNSFPWNGSTWGKSDAYALEVASK
jgi:hypothetical protein